MKHMPGLYELWDLMAALKTSPAFAIALPFLVAIVLASIVDWIERRLKANQETASRHWADDTDVSPDQHYSWRLTPAGRPLLEGGDREHT